MSGRAPGSEHVTDDRLIDLERGLIARDERAATLAHVRACAECEQRFLQIAREAETLAFAPVPRLAAPAGRRRVAVLVAAAGIAVATILTTTLLERSRSDGLDYWLPVESEGVVLRSLPSSGENASLLEALEAYRRHDLRRVLELLDGREIPEPYAFLNLFYASALLWDGRYDDAKAVLDRANIYSLPQPYRDRARWELYVVLERSGRSAEAEPVLRDLASRPGEFAERARERLTRLPAPPSE